jgi:adenosylcobinamide-phosphate synthase
MVGLMPVPAATAIAAASGLVVDQLVGEPPSRLHPVVHYATAMQRLEQRLYADRRSNGVVFTLAGVGLGVAAGVLLRRLLGARASTVVATALCAAGKMLDDEAAAIAALLEADDLAGARMRIVSLVGRDTDDLRADDMSRAAVESLAENCVDAVTASLCWAAVGGAPAVLAHRAINTLDAMVGHRNDRYERFGWASARLDDVVNHVPARLTALGTAIARPRRAREVLRIVRRDAGQHPSPNGGVVEAAFAAALGVQLGGVNRYGDVIEDRGTLGDGPSPTPATIRDAITLRRQATAATAVVVLLAVAVVRR